MELNKLVEQMEDVRAMMVKHKQMVSEKLVVLSVGNYDTKDTREFEDRLLRHISGLNTQISIIEFNIRDIKRKIEMMN